MKALAFANNDMAVVAWTFGGKLADCLGFAVYRIDVRAGTETCLPAMATFPKQAATPGRTTADDPVQKFFWKDVYAKRGGTYKYKIVPMGGTPGDKLQPLPFGPLVSNTIQLSPHYGLMSAYFNRGILATQSTAHQLHGNDPGGMKGVLLKRIENLNDQLRKDLAGQMIEALTTLPDEALANGGECFNALYEFEDQELIGHLAKITDRAHLILSNMPGTVGDTKEKTNDTYADQRQQIKEAGADVTDRFMKSGHIGHNKFTILADTQGAPQAVQFGSTNWTSRALCAQTNNSVIARSPKLASAYKTYWDALKSDTGKPTGSTGATAQQGATLRTADAHGGKPTPVPLEDGSGTVDIWFSPNTPSARASGAKKANEAVPPDLAEVFSIIHGAQEAILFLAFQPGSPSIVGEIAKAQLANPSLFVRGALTDGGAASGFYVAIKGEPPTKPQKPVKGAPPPPQDYRVISARSIPKDGVGQWEQELNSAGHAVIHDKILVVDPFSDNCVVVTGSHNLGYTASYNNDENMAIIRGHRGLAEAYAAHVLDVYDHYAWRYWLQQKKYDAAWTFLTPSDAWQNTYFDASNKVKSAELNFWLSSSPASESLPTPVDPTIATRSAPAMQTVMGGVSPATGPVANPAPAAATKAPAKKSKAKKAKAKKAKKAKTKKAAKAPKRKAAKKKTKKAKR
jgi:phosphatidylserine/phosphatidylglycerophosphate/cardiolipin synthase-like enzyme